MGYILGSRWNDNDSWQVYLDPSQVDGLFGVACVGDENTEVPYIATVQLSNSASPLVSSGFLTGNEMVSSRITENGWDHAAAIRVSSHHLQTTNTIASNRVLLSGNLTGTTGDVQLRIYDGPRNLGTQSISAGPFSIPIEIGADGLLHEITLHAFSPSILGDAAVVYLSSPSHFAILDIEPLSTPTIGPYPVQIRLIDYDNFADLNSSRLHYSQDGQTWTSTHAAFDGAGSFWGSIPDQFNGTRVQYYATLLSTSSSRSTCGSNRSPVG